MRSIPDMRRTAENKNPQDQLSVRRFLYPDRSGDKLSRGYPVSAMNSGTKCGDNIYPGIQDLFTKRRTMLQNKVDYEMTSIKKVQQVINTIVYSGLLFVMLMQSFFFDGWTHWAEDAHFFIDSSQLLQIAFFLSCLATLLEMPLSGPRALLAAIMIIIPRVFPVTHQNFLLTEMVLLVSLSNLNTRRQNITIWMLTHVLYMVLLFWLGYKGFVVPVITETKTVLGISTLASSFGMGHPNSFALFIMSTVMMLWLIVKKHLHWWMTVLLFFIGSAIVLYFTLCRTVCIIMLVFPLINIIIVKLQGKERKGIKRFILLLPIIMMMITIGISLIVLQSSNSLIDGNFAIRFRDFRYIISEYHMPFGSSDIITGIWICFDNLYLMLIACCGYIPTIIALLSCGGMMMHLLKQKDTELLIVTIIFLLYGIMENAMIYSIYFFVPILAFADRKDMILTLSGIRDNIEINKMEEPDRGL